MITHYTMAAEIDRQRREQIAASIAAARRRTPHSLRRWWQFDVPHRSASPVPPDPTVLSGTATASRFTTWRLTATRIKEQ